MRFSPMLLMFIAVALLGALVMPPDFANSLRKVDLLFAPVASPVRKLAEAMNDHWSSNAAGRPADDRNMGELREENNALKLKLLLLSAQIEDARRRLGEVDRLRPEISKLCRTFRVMGSPPGDRQMLTLDASSLLGLEPQMAVLCPDCLVGKVDMAGLAEARAVLLTDKRMTVQVAFRRYVAKTSESLPLGDAPCAATGNGAGRLVVDHYQAEDVKSIGLRVGDWVVLSDSDWPEPLKGYKIGVIEEIDPGSTGLFYKLIVRPDVDLMKLHNVMVLVRNK